MLSECLLPKIIVGTMRGFCVSRNGVLAAMVVIVAVIALGLIRGGFDGPVLEKAADVRVVTGPVTNTPRPQPSTKAIVDVTDRHDKIKTPIAPRPTPERVARIVAQFVAKPMGVPPPGYDNQTTLDPQFAREGRTSRSDRATDDLQTVFRDVPSLDSELMAQGIECRETLCRMVGSFDSDAQGEDIGSAMHGLQISVRDRLHKAGFARAMIRFSNRNYMAFYRISPLRR